MPAVNNSIEFDESYTLTQLRSIAKEKGIPAYSTKNKSELLEALNDGI
ncbi:Rho termination factor N-terminal domain-containing protein [uncultured Robinsoniella sp.]